MNVNVHSHLIIFKHVISNSGNSAAFNLIFHAHEIKPLILQLIFVSTINNDLDLNAIVTDRFIVVVHPFYALSETSPRPLHNCIQFQSNMITELKRYVHLKHYVGQFRNITKT